MLSQQLELREQSQRVRVEMEPHSTGCGAKILVENYDDRLGWYTSASLSLPLHQLALLEQAIEAMRAGGDESESAEGTIVPFPG